MKEPSGRRTGRQGKRLAAAAIVLAIIAAGAAFLMHANGASHHRAERLLSDARVALGKKKYDEAERLASQVDSRDELCGQARLVAGEAAARSGRPKSAIEHYSAIPRDGSETAVVASLVNGEVLRTIGRLSDAEREFRYVVEHQPANAAAHQRLAFLLGITGRRWEAVPHSLFLAKAGMGDWNYLFALADPERPWIQAEYLRECASNFPNDVLVQMGLAALALAEERPAEAQPILREVVARAPHLVAAHAMLGELVVEADDETFARWQANLPRGADANPDVWFVRGLRARGRGKLPVAARCFWETLKLAPMHRRGTYQLGQALTALGETSGHEFTERSGKLFELTKVMSILQGSESQNEAALKRIAELMEELGRLWEARAWSAWAGNAFPRALWPFSMIQRLSPLLDEETPQTIVSANLARKYDLSGFPDASEFLSRAGTSAESRATVRRVATIKFAEAVDAGIDFVYVNGNDPLTENDERDQPRTAATSADRRVRARIRKRTRLFEQNGGGVAVLDFDGDGWPDLFFNQGCEWKHGAPRRASPVQTTDRLYRNAAGQAFVDVTLQSGLIDRDYGQGCAAGDFDNDGFVDLYVANIGRNRLQHNNGDGTFSDITEAWSREDETWTASCILVDLNADGLPDLFDVTYIAGDGVYEAVCDDDRGCSPNAFSGIPDRLYLNRGDGTFGFVPDAAPDSDSSKGLGGVAVELFDRRRPCLLIANDQMPNFLLRNFPSTDSRNVRLEDEGVASGLAFNGDGRAISSMGIAADDADGDGRIDFFVTDFKDEAKVLFLQDMLGVFHDGTNAADLRAAGLPFVGWGTQFLDADCDGEPDLVVANGHVDDFRAEGGEYHMRPQFFHNTGRGHFVELQAPGIGPWFGQKYLGRGLARLDWNRDGRMDFVVSNIGDRASLVTNVSTGTGHFLNVRLHACQTARDAIGSIVEASAGDRRWVKQLVAGDGYMASNERILQFGLGDADLVKQLRVSWPSGDEISIIDVPVDVTLELVEGKRMGLCWRGSQPETFVIAPK